MTAELSERSSTPRVRERADHDFARGTRASTVSVALQCVAVAKGGDLVGTARTVRRARELIFSEITASDDTGKVLAHGLQTYRIA
jgi:acyl-coenzyme A thioesterase PaaI-like protein